jgi:hypothetical protein
MSQFNRHELVKPGQSLPLASCDGWLGVTVRRVLIHNPLKVDPA